MTKNIKLYQVDMGAICCVPVQLDPENMSTDDLDRFVHQGVLTGRKDTVWEACNQELKARQMQFVLELAEMLGRRPYHGDIWTRHKIYEWFCRSIFSEVDPARLHQFAHVHDHHIRSLALQAIHYSRDRHKRDYYLQRYERHRIKHLRIYRQGIDITLPTIFE